MDDCSAAIALQKSNLKAWYYLAQAQLQLKHPNEAVASALQAYELCLEQNSASTKAVAELILKAKKVKWEARERQRVRERSEMLRELEGAIRQSGAREAEDVMDDEIAKEVRATTRRKVEELYSIFAIADPANMERRVSANLLSLTQST